MTYHIQVVVLKSGKAQSDVKVETSRNDDKFYTNKQGIVELEIDENPADVKLYIANEKVYDGSAYALVKERGEYEGKFVHRL